MKKWLLLLAVLQGSLQAAIYPIQFSIPEEKIVSAIPLKKRAFAPLIPGVGETYIYQTEQHYYQDYRNSYYAVTCKKGGWDCLRHYEILACGCIPYFVDLDQCDEETLSFFPKELIWEAMHLDGVSYLQIDFSKFDLVKYYDLLNRLLVYTRERLTTRKMAEYLLKTVHYSGEGKILYLSCSVRPDLLRCLTLIGLKEILQDRVIDVPKISHICKNYYRAPPLFGGGMTYSRIIDDIPVDREQIAERILAREFELIIYGSAHRGLLFHDEVLQSYPPERIIYLCGEDIHSCEYRSRLTSSGSFFFLREFTKN